MIHKIYFCRDCNTATKDEIICVVCNKNQLEIGWVEIIETGESK